MVSITRCRLYPDSGTKNNSAMGNDVSLQKSAVIDEKATEVTDYWSMYGGEWKNGGTTQHLSLFKGETALDESFWKINPLDKAGKV